MKAGVPRSRASARQLRIGQVVAAALAATAFGSATAPAEGAHKLAHGIATIRLGMSHDEVVRRIGRPRESRNFPNLGGKRCVGRRVRFADRLTVWFQRGPRCSNHADAEVSSRPVKRFQVILISTGSPRDRFRERRCRNVRVGVTRGALERARSGSVQAVLDHPNIIPVHEAGESPHGLYLAMRFVSGPTVKEMIDDGPLAPLTAVGLLRPVADALTAAHEAGLVHRDVKPNNVLVGSRSHPYLADFGLIKAVGSTKLTESGHFLGTVDYIAPEQIAGDRPTPETDVYSFAAMLYECFTGTVPFPREAAPCSRVRAPQRSPAAGDRSPADPGEGDRQGHRSWDVEGSAGSSRECARLDRKRRIGTSCALRVRTSLRSVEGGSPHHAQSHPLGAHARAHLLAPLGAGSDGPPPRYAIAIAHSS